MFAKRGVHLAAAIGVLLFFIAQPAWAFKIKAHVVAANLAREGFLVRRSSKQLRLYRYGDVTFDNQLAAEAIISYPTYYRAGALGPDAFPDIIAGQLWVHVNKGELLSPPVTSEVALQRRTFEAWRSIDYGMYLLSRAYAYMPGTAEQMKAVAFAHGYLSHIAGDGFAHSYINEWSRGVFSYFEGSGTYGTLTEELQHLAAEGYLDAHLDLPSANAKIETPVAFLNAVFMSPLDWSGTRTAASRVGGASFANATLGASAPAGAVGGVYFVELLKLRDMLARMSDWHPWTSGLSGPSSQAFRASLRLQELLAHPVGGIGDPVRDIEDYFDRHRRMVDALITKWTELSGCVAQNMLNGAVISYGSVFDACALHDFESDSVGVLRDIFSGTLNEAAHYPNRVLDKNGKPLAVSGTTNGYDFGSFGNNAKKLAEFVRVVMQRFVAFDPVADIRTLRELRDIVEDCDALNIGPAACESACEMVVKVCDNVACFGCPTSGDRYSCSGWRNAFQCAFLPHCFACVSQLTKVACSSSDSVVAPVICDLCNGNPACKTLDATLEMQTLLTELIHQAVAQIVEPLVNQVQQRLFEAFAGPYVNDFAKLYSDMERMRKGSMAAAFVNIAFLREDLQADPNYLTAILQRGSDVGALVLDNAGSVADATGRAVAQTERAARTAMTPIILVYSGQTYESIWRGLVETLYRMSKDQSFDAARELPRAAYAWLDGFQFKTPNNLYESRIGKFAALTTKLGMFYGIRGTSAQAMSREMGLDDSAAGSFG